VPILSVNAVGDTSERFTVREFGDLIDSRTSVPGSFHYEVDLARFFSFPGIPPANPADTPINLVFELEALADCDDAIPCSAESRLENTLYIKLDGTSESGYSYLGREIVDPPPTGIPAPASGLLVLAGLAAIAAFRRR
jgi:hypothetical protein